MSVLSKQQLQCAHGDVAFAAAYPHPCNFSHTVFKAFAPNISIFTDAHRSAFVRRTTCMVPTQTWRPPSTETLLCDCMLWRR